VQDQRRDGDLACQIGEVIGPVGHRYSDSHLWGG
jgi:hypothetical protein